MKMSLKTLIAAAFSFVALGATSCSEKQAENAGAATENAANSAGNAMENAADSVQGDMAREKGDTAVVVDKPANGVIEETPATQK